MRDFSVIKDNILKYLDYKGISKYKFYQQTGITNGILSQKNGLSEENTLKFLSCFPDINPEWLLTGEGQMIKTEQVSQTSHNTKGIPLIPVEAMAGYANGDTQVMDYDIHDNYIITPEFENRGIKYLIRVSGSSMTPKYNNGDLIACRPIADNSFIQWGKVYVLDTDQGPLVKRLYPCNPNNDDCLECRSDNFEKYPPFKIEKTSIRRMAIVVGVLRLE